MYEKITYEYYTQNELIVGDIINDVFNKSINIIQEKQKVVEIEKENMITEYCYKYYE